MFTALAAFFLSSPCLFMLAMKKYIFFGQFNWFLLFHLPYKSQLISVFPLSYPLSKVSYGDAIFSSVTKFEYLFIHPGNSASPALVIARYLLERLPELHLRHAQLAQCPPQTRPG
jgi:hypothetical protein